MSPPTRRPLRSAPLAALGLALTTFPGCLTRALWSPDETTAGLIQIDTLCQIHSVKGHFLQVPSDGPVDPTRTGAIDVEFSVRREKHTPVELRRFAETRGRMRLHPRPTDQNWFALPGAEMLQPKLWKFGAFFASYFKESGASIPLVFVGDLKPEEAGTLVPVAKAPPAWGHLKPLRDRGNLHPLDAASRAAFSSRNWIQLLTGERDFSDRDTHALAWLDGDGRVIPAAEFERHLRAAEAQSTAAGTGSADLSRYTLLGKLDGAWGKPVYVRVPLPLLVQGKKLELKRMGSRVFWRREQVWTGIVRDATEPEPSQPSPVTDAPAAFATPGIAATSVPLLTDQFVYTFAAEDSGEPILTLLAKVLLTPPAVLLDFAAQTFVGYAEIVRWLAAGNNREWSGPVAPERRR